MIAQAEPERVVELKALVKRALAGDRAVEGDLREMLDGDDVIARDMAVFAARLARSMGSQL